MNPPNPQTTLDYLADLVRQLTKQVETLWQAVDDLREEIFAEFQHLRDEPLDQEDEAAAKPPFYLTSMPRDACDPDFHRKVNIAKPDEAPAHRAPESLEEFLGRLTAEGPIGRLTLEDWNGDQQLPPGKVLEIDADIFDWFAGSFEIEFETAKCSYLLVGDDDWRCLLWSDDSRCFVRRLTAAESDVGVLLKRRTGEVAVHRKDIAASPAEHSEVARQQGTLW